MKRQKACVCARARVCADDKNVVSHLNEQSADKFDRNILPSHWWVIHVLVTERLCLLFTHSASVRTAVKTCVNILYATVLWALDSDWSIWVVFCSLIVAQLLKSPAIGKQSVVMVTIVTPPHLRLFPSIYSSTASSVLFLLLSIRYWILLGKKKIPY